ncbi:MAG: plasmid mobilization protein [Desulfurivibrionaceae bacterium]
MATATERIPVLVSRKEKIDLAEKARQSKVSMGEYLRRAAAAYRTTEDDALLEGMITQMLKTTEQAEQAIDNALAFVEASNQRIAAMESSRRV